MFVTFYSYKGGAGRSMALANVGWILATHGKRVLLVDWDLEAPGLHRYLHPFLPDKDLVASPGVIDLMWDFVSAAMDPTAPDDPGWHEKYARISPYAISADYVFAGEGTLDLVPAGRQDGAYAQQVSTFDWSRFYQELGGGVFLDSLKADMRSHYDMVLIDSRTGVSDTSGICTVQLPDVLVNCFTASTQSIEGSAAVARSVRRQRSAGDLRILPVPMRIEDGESDKLEAARDYWQLLHRDYVRPLKDPARYWADVEVPYTAYYAYEEIPAPIGDRPGQRRTILASCESLVSYLTDGEITSVVPMPEFQRRQLQMRFHRQATVAGGWPGPDGPSRVVVSYRPGSAAHVAAVRRLWLMLREHGVDARPLALPADPAEQPYQWLLAALADADFVLVVGSPELSAADRAGDDQPALDGTGSPHAGAERPPDGLYGRVLPVLLPGGSLDDLPGYIGSISDTYFLIADFTVSGAEPLLRVLTGQRADPESGPVLGTIPVLPPDGESLPVDVYLSYAAEDEQVAATVAEGLAARGLGAIYLRGRGDTTGLTDEAEARIGQVRAFVALLSPDYLVSSLCRRDLALATERSAELQSQHFTQVVVVRSADAVASGGTARHEWLDGTDRDQLGRALDKLAARLKPMVHSPGPALVAGQRTVYFRDRATELDAIVRGLRNIGGPHFWLAIAPPQYGKSWFLDRLGATLLLEDDAFRWTVSLLDVRDLKPEHRADPGALLRGLFGPEVPATPDSATYRAIAGQIIAGQRGYLCLIDSAELLPGETARTLRQGLSEIYHTVQEASAARVRLAVVVAGRDEHGWLGVSPSPRLSVLPLAAFGVDVVRESLRSLAGEMGRAFEAARLERDAARVYQLSGGAPTLISRCLAWIRQASWLGTERLETDDLFHELARPYIEDSLLARQSLFPAEAAGTGLPESGPGSRAAALAEGLRVLSPYRLLTLSHVRHHYVEDARLSASMADAGWTIEDMWLAVSQTALLTRPMGELWEEMSPAIRRLLFRYYFPGAPNRAAAHLRARTFTAEWSSRQSGTEQAVGLVEVLWHEAARLQLQPSPTGGPELVTSAGRLSRGLRASVAYTMEEVRRFAAARIRFDDEFQAVVGDERVVGDVIAAVEQPGSE